jgi:hypothetical protein
MLSLSVALGVMTEPIMSTLLVAILTLIHGVKGLKRGLLGLPVL